MKVLVIGRTGQIGGSIIRQAPPELEVVCPTRDELDLDCIDEAIEFIKATGPDVIINATGFHNVPLCESESPKAFEINCMAVSALAASAREVSARFVTFTTDYVFDGKKRTPYIEDDRPGPLQVYGITKLSGEYAALSAYPEGTTIVRTCGVYGLGGGASKGGNFVDKRVEDWRRGVDIEMGSDQTVSPTFAEDLASCLLKLLIKGHDPGIYHLANQGECTWFEFTEAVFSLMGEGAKVTAVDRGGVTGKMRRPLYSALSSKKAAALGAQMPPWRDALERYILKKYGDKA